MGGAAPVSAGSGRGATPCALQPGVECCFHSIAELRNAARWSGANPGLSHACRALRAFLGLAAVR
jgi:hypothetical protein